MVSHYLLCCIDSEFPREFVDRFNGVFRIHCILVDLFIEPIMSGEPEQRFPGNFSFGATQYSVDSMQPKSRGFFLIFLLPVFFRRSVGWSDGRMVGRSDYQTILIF